MVFSVMLFETTVIIFSNLKQITESLQHVSLMHFNLKIIHI